MNWSRFIPFDFEYDWESDKLAEHGVSFEEAVETFFSDYEVRRNKRFRDRYQLIGRTEGGRRVRIIFQLKPDGFVKSPSAALRFTFRHCRVLLGTPHSSRFARLESGAFYRAVYLGDFLRNHQA